MLRATARLRLRQSPSFCQTANPFLAEQREKRRRAHFERENRRRGRVENNVGNASGSRPEEALGRPLGDASESVEDDATTLKKYQVDQTTWRAAKREFVWVKNDKLKLGQLLLHLCQTQKLDLALALARLASLETDGGTVAWNILIKYHCDHEPRPAMSKAMERYQEMRKRGQKPDQYTYGTLLGGYAKYTKLEFGASKHMATTAHNLFKKMKESGLYPSIHHVNSVVSVASRYENKELLWQILEELPEEGLDAPTSMTFTMLLNGLKLKESDFEPLKLSEYEPKRREMVNNACAVWHAAVNLWKQGRIQMDSHLVAAMANILVMGPHSSDWSDVFRLIQQTTGIKLEEGTRHTIPGHHSMGSLPEGKPIEEGPRSCFDPVDDAKVRLVTPNTHILTVVMLACQRLRANKAASYYWSILTGVDGYNVKPDMVAVKTYLGLLRYSRSSRQAMLLLKKHVTKENFDHGAFRIAMATCKRNSLRPGTLDEAMELIDLWHDLNPRGFDTHVLASYTNVVAGATENEQRKKALLMISHDAVAVLKQTKNLGWRSEAVETGARQRQLFEQDSLTLNKRLIGIIDQLVNDEHTEVPKELLEMKNRLADWVRLSKEEQRERSREILVQREAEEAEEAKRKEKEEFDDWQVTV